MYAKSIILVVLLECLLELFGSIECAMTLEQMEKTAAGFRNSCLPKTGTTEDLVAGIKVGQFPEDRNLQCYTLCVMKALRTFKNGKVDSDMVVKQVDMLMPVNLHEGMKSAARKCASVEPADDPCMTTYNYVKCNYMANPETFFFP